MAGVGKEEGVEIEELTDLVGRLSVHQALSLSREGLL